MIQNKIRTEKDSLGEKEISAEALYGIHTLRAKENFPLSFRSPHTALICAYGHVKLASMQTNRSIGAWANNEEKANAIESACKEMAGGLLNKHIIVDALQGGAGTSTNMNVNEVLANRSLQLIDKPIGSYNYISPVEDINRHQSTNDTYPTALKLASIRSLKNLEENISNLVEAFQAKEKEFASILKIGRTELQDAVPLTLGRAMSAYAEAFGRDRWRIYKCEERLRVINLGGTAIGTGLGAPRDYIFRVVDTLRSNTGIGFARAENMIDNTQNADVFVEVSGILKAFATTLIKCASDLKLLSSGPECGLGEINLPPQQAGSSIMPHKVNPVIPEAVMQTAIRYIAHDHEITTAASMGNLELNAFLPLIADSLLNGIDLLSQAALILRTNCIEGIEANKKYGEHASEVTSIATALIPKLGYNKASEIVEIARTSNKSIKAVVVENNILTAEEYEALISPEAVMRMGH